MPILQRMQSLDRGWSMAKDLANVKCRVAACRSGRAITARFGSEGNT